MRKIKLFQNIIAAIMLLVMAVPSVTTVFADSEEGTWYTESGVHLYGTMQNVREKKIKETNENNFGFECIRVYPTSGWIDTYAYMQMHMVNEAATRALSDVFVVRENKGFMYYDLRESHDEGDVLRISVRGNDREKEAKAAFAYNPM